MKIAAILKAQGTGDRKIESAKIVMDEEMPYFESFNASIATFEERAKELADVLCDTLPGGTLDRLLGELLTRKATCFVVPLFK